MPPAGAPSGPQLLVYVPDGPLGGTFTCTGCRAQAWQPDLLQHGPGCPYRKPAPPAPSPAECR